jgi:hypothetical protein
MQTPAPIEQTHNGFQQNNGYFVMVWDQQGVYKGQYQDDMLGDSNGPVFIGPDPTGRTQVSNLSEEQIEQAKRNSTP